VNNGNTTDPPGAAAPGSTSASLLERVKARDPEAWRRFGHLYGPLVYRWCRHWGLLGADAADIVQEVFCAVLAGLAGFRSEQGGGGFRGWLWGITRHKVADHFRRLQGGQVAQGGTHAQQLMAQIPDRPVPGASTTSQATGGEGVERRAIELIRASVEDRTWKAFWRVVVDQQPIAEVAAELDMTVKAVYETKYRLLRRLRGELGD